MKRLLIIILSLIVAAFGCSRDASVVDIPQPEPQTSDESIVAANCRVLESAVQSFAAENDGIYPGDVDSDTSGAGNTVLDLVPQGALADNPFSLKPTAPVNGAASSPGAIGYAPITESGFNVGYLVTGFGAERLVSALSNIDSPEDAKVRANCLLLQGDIEKECGQYGEYYFEYWSLGWSYGGDYHYMINPYTGIAEHAVARTASAPGEVGYTAVVREGRAVAYVITGYGENSVIIARSNLELSLDEAIVVSDCRAFQIAVDEYADEHAGAWPAAPACPNGATYGLIESNEWIIGYRIEGWSDGEKIVEMTNVQTPEDAALRVNCYLVKRAVEDFAARSGGIYPEDVDADMTPDGKTVLDLMPRGHLLRNPYTGALEPPVNHSAISDGEVGYARIRAEHPRAIDGYVITAHGERPGVVFAVSNIGVGPVDAIVMSHARTLQIAADKFAAENGGVYSGGIGYDTTPYGETIVDLLPGGALMENPITRWATEPVDGCAATTGQVGYVPVCQNGYNVGCVITGVGRENGSTIITIEVVTQGPPMEQRH